MNWEKRHKKSPIISSGRGIKLYRQCHVTWMLCLPLLISTEVEAQQRVTWANHIACLVYSHCTPCHQDDGIAPFPLQSYDDAFAHRYAMEVAIATRLMPPWPPSVEDTLISHNRALTEAEISLFRDLISQGAPEGDLAEAPKPPQSISTIEIQDPDRTITLPRYEIPD